MRTRNDYDTEAEWQDSSDYRRQQDSEGIRFEKYVARVLQSMNRPCTLIGDDTTEQLKHGDTKEGHEIKLSKPAHKTGKVFIEYYTRANRNVGWLESGPLPSHINYFVVGSDLKEGKGGVIYFFSPEVLRAYKPPKSTMLEVASGTALGWLLHERHSLHEFKLEIDKDGQVFMRGQKISQIKDN